MPVFECSRCNEMTYSASVGAITACASCGSERQRVVEGGFDEARRSVRPLEPGDHAALVYDDVTTVAPFCARFLTDGVNAGDRVFAGLPADLREAVCALLEPEVELALEWEDPRSIYGDFDPARVADSYEALIASESRTTRILAGLDAESAAGIDAGDYARYERMSHGVITSGGAIAVCLFSASALAPDLIDVAARRHGLSVEDGAAHRNERFEYQPA